MSARRLTEKQRNDVCRWYLRGDSTIKIAHRLNAATSGINSLLKRRGIKLRSGAPKRLHQLWIPENYDDGWIDNRGRFRVFRPDCPRAYSAGYALRAHVVWWLYHGKPHPRNMELHHKDENRLNDAINNLELIPNGTHQKIHKSRDFVLICRNCGKETTRIKARMRYSNNYCSYRCYAQAPREYSHKKAISVGLKMAYKEGRR